MIRKLRKYIFLVLLVLAIFKTNAQTYTISNTVHWATYNQNMWGPNGSPFNINMVIPLFDVTYDTLLNFGFMDTILGMPTGAMFTLDTWFHIGSTFEMTGFTTGWIDVNYPVQIDLTFPNNYTWNPGEIVTINSQYTVLPGWFLHSQFPHAGVVSLDLDFGFDLDLDATVCLGGCTNVSLIDVHVPLDSIAIFYINGQTGEVIYPCWNGTFFDFCHDTLLPITFNNLAGIGLSGEITIPYIETHDWLDTSDPCSQTIYAQGDSTWIYLDLDIIQFLYAIAGIIPPPQGPAIQQFLSMLSGTYTIGMITIDYTLLQANMEITSTMQQDLSFHPTVWSTLSFPTPVEYTVNNPNNGYAVLDSGYADTISFPACSDLNFRWPCFGWPQMDVGIEHSITPTFTNHTWDSLAFTFLLTALEFDISVPFPVKSLPEVEIPDFCIDVPVPCERKNKTGCTDEVCLPEIVHPKQDSLSVEDFKGTKWSYHIGPLVDLSIPLGYIPITWYNNTWELAGFHDTTVTGTMMAPNPEMHIIDIYGNNVMCAGDSSGDVTIEIEYGTPPYTYAWSNGVIDTSYMPTNTLPNVPAGTYSVTVSDVNGCSLTDQFTLVEVNPPIFIDLSSIDVLCHGDSTGSIFSSVSGGTPGYTYAWNPSGSTSANLIDIPAGFYTLTVTDAVGCTETDTITIHEPPTAVTVSTDTVIHILCYGDYTGSIQITASGGIPPYSYLWNTGSFNEDLTNIPAGNYSVTVTDANGCTYVVNETVTEPQELVASIAGTNISCYGYADGIADLTVTGGVQPYTYLWDNGITSEDLTNLFIGTYSVTVTDANGCQDSASVTLTQPAAPLSDSYEPTHVLCYGDSTGAINYEVTGGTPPYSYQWSSGQTSQDLINIPAGTYTVTVTDLHNCTLVTSIDVIQPASPLSLTFDGHDVNCYGETSGYINSIVSGGTPGYYYSWSNGFIDPNIYNLAAGIYSLTVTDAHACTITGSITIDEPDELVTSTDTSETICIGQTTTLIGSVTGGIPPYNYFWNTGDNTTTIQVSPVVTTDYTFHATDANGCVSNYSTVTVNVNPPLSLVLIADDYDICTGTPAVLTMNASGGSGNYFFVLNDTISIWQNYTVYPTVPTTYTVQLSDDCGTPVVQDEVTIYVMDSPPLSMSADTLSGCAPLTVHFNEMSPDIGQTYLWNFNDDYANTYSEDKSPVHTFTMPGSYDITLTVSSDSGCTSTNTFNNMINVYETPIAQFIPDPNVVNVVYPQIYFQNISTGYDSCYWYFGDGDSSSVCSPEHIFPDIPAIYNVELIVSNVHDCRDTAFTTIEVRGGYTFYAPTAFSPDDDGVNDYFRVYATNIDLNTFHLYVFDRWGEIIFETEDINQVWDGRVNGNKYAKNGVYTWFASFKDKNGLGHEETGTVTVIR